MTHPLADRLETPAAVAATPSADDLPSPIRFGMLLVLSAELMLFSGLIAAYLVLRGGNGELFRESREVLSGTPALVAVVVMLVGCIAITVAVRLAPLPVLRRRLGGGDSVLVKAAIIAALLGLLAMTCIAWQWNALLNRLPTDSYGPSRNVFFSCYYLLTGALLLHVLAAALLAAGVAARATRQTLTPDALTAVAYCWQFVCAATCVVVWLLYWT